MLDLTPRAHSLVLYKGQPALVQRADDKLDILLADGKTVKVRAKDVQLLHPGPVESFRQLQPPPGELQAAWELLAGGETTLQELAELIYGDWTPAAAWATWQLVEEGVHFRRAGEAIRVASAEEVAAEQAARARRAAEQQAWAACLERVRQGRYAPEDERFLRDVEDQALGRRERTNLLRDLGRAQSKENAHALLLEVGYWTPFVNPHPQRLGVPTEPPAVPLPPLPDEERLDLTHLPAFAIDDEGSSDPDDAVSWDGERLWVHVADVAALVTPDSPADLEAQGRGANLYLPEGTVPMLPPEATERLALGLTEVSPALSFALRISGDGEVVDVEIRPTWVRATRLTYEQVEAQLAEEPFATLHRLARLRAERRKAHGALSLDLPEVKIRVQDGQVQIKPLPSLQSRELVSEAMLAAGEAGAAFALANQIPIPFTTQDRPDPPEEPLPDGMAGMYALRKTLKRSQQSSVPTPHSGLGLDAYVRLTSPLRRYLDLVAHQQLRAFLQGRPPLDTQAVLERVGAAEAVTGAVAYAERLSRQHWTLVYLLQHPKWRGQGVVVEAKGPRATLLIPELAWETKLTLRRELPLNSVVPLTLVDVDLPNLEAYFRAD